MLLGQTQSGSPFTLPAEAATEAIGIFARRGAGKSYTGRVLVEEFLALGVQTVVIDPLDVWYGLRSGPDGGKGGFGVYIFGGRHGDVPLEEAGGKLVADWILENGASVVLSTRHFPSNAAQSRFVLDFLKRLYHRKQEVAFPNPLHVVLDECDLFVPQKVKSKSDVPMALVGAVENLVRRGRSSGFGVTLISQRPASVNTDVRTQVEILIALQTVGPHDRRALEDWIDLHDDAERGPTFLKSLPGLQVGTAWIWSPSLARCFELVKVRRIKTFDSMRTPKMGEKRTEPKIMRQVDLDGLKKAMAETIERAKQDDPKELKAEIARLKKEKQPSGLTQADLLREAEVIARKAIGRTNKQMLEEMNGLGGLISKVIECAGKAEDLIESVKAFAEPSEFKPMNVEMPPITPSEVLEKRYARPSSRSAPRAEANGLGKCERALLAAFARKGALTRERAGLIAGYSHGSGGVGTALSALRGMGLVDGYGEMKLTGEGEAKANINDSPFELLSYWRGKLGKCERELFDAILTHGPVSRDGLSSYVSYSVGSGGVGTALSSLRSLGLVKGYGAMEVAEDLR